MDDNFIIYIDSEKLKFTFDSKNEELQKSHIDKDFKIRKLTPKECFRLMGLKDKDIEMLINSELSDCALYRLAGNSIVKNILDFIHINSFKQKKGKSFND